MARPSQDVMERQIVDYLSTHEPSTVETICEQIWHDQSLDQAALEVIWQLIGQLKLTLTSPPDRKFTLINSSTPTPGDQGLIKQWMDLVNELVDGLVADVNYEMHLPDDFRYKLRLMKHLTDRYSVTPATISIPYLHTCPHCGKGYDKAFFKATGRGGHFCPHCKGEVELTF